MTGTLEVHTHSYIRNKSGQFSHSHVGGSLPHSHTDTGPACYTIAKEDWLMRTLLKGGGVKRFTSRPTGPVLA